MATGVLSNPPVLNGPPQGRRHSSFEPTAPTKPLNTHDPLRASAAGGSYDPRRGSTASSRKTSDTPAWLTAMNERNASVSSAPETRRHSVIDGLFGRRKSKDATATAKPKTVLTSKHSGLVRNILKADPRTARKMSKDAPHETANKEQVHGPFITAKEQEERHPHSGPPTPHGMPPLAPIISRVDDDERSTFASSMKDDVIRVSMPEDRAETERPVLERKRSVQEVEFKAGPRARQKMVFGGWQRDSKGNWTRSST